MLEVDLDVTPLPDSPNCWDESDRHVRLDHPPSLPAETLWLTGRQRDADAAPGAGTQAPGPSRTARDRRARDVTWSPRQYSPAKVPSGCMVYTAVACTRVSSRRSAPFSMRRDARPSRGAHSELRRDPPRVDRDDLGDLLVLHLELHHQDVVELLFPLAHPPSGKPRVLARHARRGRHDLQVGRHGRHRQGLGGAARHDEPQREPADKIPGPAHWRSHDTRTPGPCWRRTSSMIT